MNCSEIGCSASVYSRTLCRKHYDKARRPPKQRTTLAERFWQKVSNSGSDGDCWLWTGRLGNDGYGQISAEGRKRMAHRVSYELMVAEIPVGLELDHLCYVRSCVNPEHLKLQNRQQNCQNRSGSNSNSSTGVRGVYLRSSGRYRVKVGHNRQQYDGGTFDTLAEAKQEAISLRIRLHTNNLVDRASNLGGEQ